MTYNDAKQVIKDIDLLEKDLMRDLTDEEKDLVVTNGWQKLFAVLGLSVEEYKLLKKVKTLIGTYFTGTDEAYDKLVEKEDMKEVAEVLRDLANDIDPQEKPVPEKDPFMEIIDRLKAGEVLNLKPEVVDMVLEWLEDNLTNYAVSVRNGKVSLKV